MNKNEYLDRLSRLLADISYEEHEEALSYYREYIEDAGGENEQRVIEELGTPEQLAQEIREGLLNNGEPSRKRGEPINAPEPVTDNRRTDPNSMDNNSTGNARQPKSEKDKSNTILIILLLIATSPIWFSLAFSVTATLFACVVAVAAAGIACLITGVALIAVGIPPLFALSTLSSLAGLALIGAGLVTTSLGILFIVLTVWLFGWAFPAFIRFIRQTISSVSCRREAHV